MMCGQGNGDGVADLSPAWKIPFIGEIPALLGLDWINAAAVVLKEDTRIIRLLHEGQTLSVGPQTGVSRDEG